MMLHGAKFIQVSLLQKSSNVNPANRHDPVGHNEA
jgi:hypothetical protein